MVTGKKLLSKVMPHGYKQGVLYLAFYIQAEQKPYGNKRKRKIGHIRKHGQGRLRKQLKYELLNELDYETQ